MNSIGRGRRGHREMSQESDEISQEELTALQVLADYLFMDQYTDMVTYPISRTTSGF